MNVHGLLDVATVELGARLLGDDRFFARSLQSPPLTEVATDSTCSVGALRAGAQREVAVETPVGTYDAAYLPWQWHGPDHPTLLYHHGSGEDPFESGRFASNSFRRLFVDREPFPANVVAVRAPFHGGTNREYARAMGDLENFVGMLAASVALVDALAGRARSETGRPVLAAGISLGGWVVNLHRACFDSLDRYVPLLAGAALGELFVSSAYRTMVGDRGRANPERLRSVLDFESAFRAVEADDCVPLLARYDRIIEYESQRPGYGEIDPAELPKGHVTGALATGALRDHLLGALTGRS